VRLVGSSAIGCCLGWLAVAAAVSWGMVVVRARVLASIDNEAGRDAWRVWKEESQRQSQGTGPVQRRAVESDEAPSVVLLRDHFAAALVSCLLVASAIWGFLWLTIRGSLSRRE
jgi:hypothetical protein